MAAPVSFSGGMSVPWEFARLHATIPFADLIIDDQNITFRVKLIMPKGVVVPLNQVEHAFRLRNSIRYSGIGIRWTGSPVGFFWTYSQQDAILAALAARGVLILPGEQKVVGWLSPHSEDEAMPPILPSLLMALIPVLILLGITAAVVIAVLMLA